MKQYPDFVISVLVALLVDHFFGEKNETRSLFLVEIDFVPPVLDLAVMTHLIECKEREISGGFRV